MILHRVAAPWLWLYGPPGVGKSATGFRLFERLVERGERVAFIEIDQIGMCMPAPLQARSAAKADNLLGMLDTFESVGSDGVIVSGDIAETMRDVLARARHPLVLCRLRADDDTTLERLTIREGTQWAMSSEAYESYDVPTGDLDVTTRHLGIDEVAGEILRQLGPWPPAVTATKDAVPPPALALDDPPTILVTGPRAVGTSMTAWQVLMASLESGRCTAYLDLDQLAFLPPDLRDVSLATKLANVATCWTGFQKQGAERLVLCGHLEGDDLLAVRDLTRSLRIVALTASPETMRSRTERRRCHKEIWLPGDDLFGSDAGHVLEITNRAAHFDSTHADLVIDTDGLTPSEVAGRIATHWPHA